MSWYSLCATLFLNFLWSAKGRRYIDGSTLDMVIWLCGPVQNARVLQWMSMLHKTYNVPHIWNYFETKHDKVEHDGASACIKTTLRREEMGFTINPHTKDPESIFQWCFATMLDRTKVQHTSIGAEREVRNFWQLVDINRSRFYSCTTV